MPNPWPEPVKWRSCLRCREAEGVAFPKRMMETREDGQTGGDPAPWGDDEAAAVAVPITDELDLHTYSPRDLGILLPEYLREARRLGLRQVRIIHGKGTGALRESVRAQLARLPGVLGWRTGNETEGSWGATIVQLDPAAPLGD